MKENYPVDGHIPEKDAFGYLMNMVEEKKENIHDINESDRKYMFLVGALLFLLSVIVFVNVFKNDFVGYDDQGLILNNQLIRSLSPENILQMFMPRHRGNYQPIRTLSYAADYAFWGLRPFGFQLTNIILHAITVIGVWCLVRKLVPGLPALLAAMVFAVHPVHVESVTWISARKDVLSLTFFLLAILLYERSESQRKLAPYFGSIVATALALLSKLTTVTIPLCIFLFEICRDGWPGITKLRSKAIKLFPLILLVCLAVGLNFLRTGPISSHGDALAGLEQTGQKVGRDIRLSMPLVVCRYFGLLFLPVNMSTHYDVAHISEIADPRFLVPLAFLMAIVVIGFVCFIRGHRLIAFCIGWFFITLLPASNIIPTAMMMTDRYMHIPSIGAVTLIAITVGYQLDKMSAKDNVLKKKMSLIPIIFILLLFSILTIRRNSDWRDTTTLFKRTLLVNPKSIDAFLAIGAMHALSGDYDSAIKVYNDALEIDPEHYRILYNLGISYLNKGWLSEAIGALEKSRSANPDFSATHFNLALSYHRQKRYDEAIAEHRETLRLNPNRAASFGDIGRIYIETGKSDLALIELNRALELQHDLAPALIDRAGLLMQLGRDEEAERDLKQLESLGADVPELRARFRAGAKPVR